jgi:hypothetical protein
MKVAFKCACRYANDCINKTRLLSSRCTNRGMKVAFICYANESSIIYTIPSTSPLPWLLSSPPPFAAPMKEPRSLSMAADRRQYTLFNLLRAHAYVAVDHHLRLLCQRRLHPHAMPVSRRLFHTHTCMVVGFTFIC